MIDTARRLLPMAVLYGGRLGVAALGLIILPWLSARMSPTAFGLAATVLSLQSLALVLDLGLSITIARDFAAVRDIESCRSLMRRSERNLLVAYAAITGLALVLAALAVVPVSMMLAAMIGFSLLVIVWQNIVIVGFIGRRSFIIATIVQFTSLLARHVASLLLVILVEPTIEMFVAGQMLGGAAVLAVSRTLLWHGVLRADSVLAADRMPVPAPISIAVMIHGAAGAFAMQLDKPLLAALASPTATGPYFLASLLAMVPITFLATPVTQFVQPALIASLAEGRRRDALRWIVRLTIAILVLAVLPGIAIALAADTVVDLWLPGTPGREAVARYIMLIMPGAALGALGLVPAIVLIARRDYRAMAILSSTFATAVLTAAALFAANGNIDGVCITYAIYHAAAAIALWWRAFRIEPCLAGGLLAIRAHIANDDADPSPGASA